MKYIKTIAVFPLSFLSMSITWAQTANSSVVSSSPSRFHSVSPLSIEQIKNAKPIVLQPQNRTYLDKTVVNRLATSASVISQQKAAVPPSMILTPNNKAVFTPNSASVSDNNRTQPADAKPNYPNANYTTSYVNNPVPNNAQYWPWRTIGKLYFTKSSGGASSCSATVIAKRVIMTAGHCVHSGNGNPNGWHNNFVFVPAAEGGVEPFGRWYGKRAFTSQSWYVSGGNVPNRGDYAAIVLHDRDQVLPISNITGSLGWKTYSLQNNITTKFGYPCNFDWSCLKMVQSVSDNYLTTNSNTVESPNDMGGGSSGGPWIQNFNMAVSREGGGLRSEANRIVGIMSYTTGWYNNQPNTTIGMGGSSILDNDWVNVYNTACADAAGNC